MMVWWATAMHGKAEDQPTVSFVVPCYNEQANIAAAVTEIEAAAHEALLPSFEIVVVDDCSVDRSRELVTQLAAEKSHLRLVANPQNLGFGGAYKTGVRNARGNYVIMIPGDNSHPSSGITPILRRVGEADIVIPYASNPEARSVARQVLSSAFTRLVNLLFGLKIAYFNGCVLHKTDHLKQIEIRTNGFAYQAEALVKLIRAGANYTEIPVAISERSNGKTSAFKLKNIYRVGMAMVTVWFDIHGARRKPTRRIVPRSVPAPADQQNSAVNQ